VRAAWDAFLFDRIDSPRSQTAHNADVVPCKPQDVHSAGFEDDPGESATHVEGCKVTGTAWLVSETVLGLCSETGVAGSQETDVFAAGVGITSGGV